MRTIPQGFRAAGLPRHDRPRPSRHGLAIFYSERPATAAACFTTNLVKAVHIPLDRQRLRLGKAQAIMVNSGCANCCTGERGMRDAEKSIQWASRALRIPASQILIASTGVIGDFLPMDLLSKEIPRLARKVISDPGLSYWSFHKASEAILTTDTKIKTSSAVLRSRGLSAPRIRNEIRIWGCAKGAGMIHPVMTPSGRPRRPHATMLAFLFTDAEVDRAYLEHSLAKAVDVSFNRVTVDGDTSTNDSAFLLANGASRLRITTPADRRAFEHGLNQVCVDLAKQMAMDGEGASKFLEIRIEGAHSEADAQRMAMIVATSPLVKTAAYGEDSNWGRVLGALGRAGVPLDPAKVDIYFGDLCVFRRGSPTNVSAEKAREPLRAKEVTIRIHVHLGKASGLYWTCDFTGQYVDINARYRT
jgi:glutamate N-acetyltransferase/amino-acid N-acetyltransferase